MILQTMNDDEKFYEAFRIVNKAKEVWEANKKNAFGRFLRGSHFPYFIHTDFEDNGNKWRIIYMCKSKNYKKKKCFFSLCYTTYSIEKKKKNGNGGKGILWFDPSGLWHHTYTNDGKDHGFGFICDIIPHAFNRYTERFLTPRGLELSFDRKVEDLMYRWKWFDVVGDKSSKKYVSEKGMSYDVFIQGGGMLRGQILDPLTMRLFTFVSEDMYFANQKDRQETMLREYQLMKYNGARI